MQELVKKFLTRELTYSDLLKNVNEADRKIDILKKDNEELTNRLNELKIETAASAQVGSDGKHNFQDEDILNSNKQIQELKREYGMLQEKFKKVNIVNDQVSNWARRVYTKFAALTDNQQLQRQPDDLVKIFEAMETVTTTELKAMKVRGDDGGE